MKLLLILAFVLTFSTAFAATGGAPTAPGPGPVPAFGIYDLNDNGVDDDHRTNETDIIFKAYGGIISLSHSMLTDYYGGTRTDELTVMYGVENKFDNIWSITAIGGRYTGDGLGQPIQNTFHRAIGQNDSIFHLRTEYSGESLVVSQEFGYLTLTEEGGYTWKARVVAASDLVIDGEASGHVIMPLGKANLFIGCKGVANTYPSSNNYKTSKFTRDFERGTYVDFAFQWGFIDFGISIKTDNGSETGYLGLIRKF